MVPLGRKLGQTWDLNQVLEIPKPYSVVSCRFSMPYWPGEWGDGVWTELVEQVRGHLEGIRQIIFPQMDAVSSVI